MAWDNADDGAATSAGSGGSSGAESVPSGTPVAVGGAVFGEPRGGASAVAGQPETPPGGGPGAIGGASPADEGGEGGEGGEGDDISGPECPSRTVGQWELGYFPELRDATTQESHPFFQITNRAAFTTLDRIKIRYYFTRESDMAETAVCYWVTGDRCSLAKMDFSDVPVPAPQASRYLQVSFPGASNVTVAPGRLEVRVGFKTGSALLTQTNDYSFDANAASPSSFAPFPYKRWARATLYVDDELVWGTEPCPR